MKSGLKFRGNLQESNMKIKVICLVMALLLGVLSGCSVNADGTEKKVVLTTGFDDNEVFQIDTETCTLPEAMV